MKKYRVTFEKKAAVWYASEVVVSARNEEEARRKASEHDIDHWDEVGGETEDVSIVSVERID